MIKRNNDDNNNNDNNTNNNNDNAISETNPVVCPYLKEGLHVEVSANSQSRAETRDPASHRSRGN